MKLFIHFQTSTVAPLKFGYEKGYSPYKKGYSCQHVILRLTEYLRQALDNGSAVGTVAMDLSRAFDKMPHALLIAKLNAYGLS